MIYLEPEGEPEIDGQAYVQRFKSNGMDIDKIRQFSIQRNDQKFLSREGVERWRETKSWWPIKATKLSAVECKVEFEAAVHAEFGFGSIYQLDFCDENYNVHCLSRISWSRMGSALGLPLRTSASVPPPPSPVGPPVKTVLPIEVPTPSASTPMMAGSPPAGTIVFCEDGHEMVRGMGTCLWCGKSEGKER